MNVDKLFDIMEVAKGLLSLRLIVSGKWAAALEMRIGGLSTFNYPRYLGILMIYAGVNNYISEDSDYSSNTFFF